MCIMVYNKLIKEGNLPHYEEYKNIKNFNEDKNIRVIARIVGEFSTTGGYLEVTKENYRLVHARIKTLNKVWGTKPLQKTYTNDKGQQIKRSVHLSLKEVKSVIGLKIGGRWAEHKTNRQFASFVTAAIKNQFQTLAMKKEGKLLKEYQAAIVNVKNRKIQTQVLENDIVVEVLA